MQTTIERKCPISGFESVVIVYDMMATEEQIDTFQSSMGGEGSEAIVQNVEGWPTQYGENPFGKAAPMLFRAWAVKQLALALAEYMSDPNS